MFRHLFGLKTSKDLSHTPNCTTLNNKLSEKNSLFKICAKISKSEVEQSKFDQFEINGDSFSLIRVAIVCKLN